MKFGLQFDLRNPERWRRDPVRLHAFTLELIEEAERLGIDSVWVSEHHRFPDDHVASPLTFLAAAAARTLRVRLGSAVVVAPLHHAAELAEQSVMIDLLSGGRFELGLGAGTKYRMPEYELYGADPERRNTQTDERARQVRALLSPGGVTPGPVQDRLPIWMGYLGPQGARRTGLLGERLLSGDARNWASYRAGLLEAGHDPAIGMMAGSVNAWVTDDPEKDWQTVRSHLKYQLDTYNEQMVVGTDRPLPRPVDPERFRAGPPVLLKYFWCETPETIASNIRTYTGGAPVDTMFIWASLPGMSEDMAVRHVQTICTELAPRLADYRPENEPLTAPPIS
jgi:alkanesulfonate monooxygenase SsuD/methylene tetrahydromethanopterin reductase-like flavin-dependent oxidoreductase (luciferase family)